MHVSVWVCMSVGGCTQSTCKHRIRMDIRGDFQYYVICFVLIDVLPMPMFVCAPVGACTCRPQVYVESLLPLHLFKTGSLTKAGVHQSGFSTYYLANKLEFSCLCLPQGWDYHA